MVMTMAITTVTKSRLRSSFVCTLAFALTLVGTVPAADIESVAGTASLCAYPASVGVWSAPRHALALESAGWQLPLSFQKPRTQVREWGFHALALVTIPTSGVALAKADQHDQADGHEHTHSGDTELEDQVNEPLSEPGSDDSHSDVVSHDDQGQHHDDEANHDHARDHNEVQGVSRVLQWIGRFHPVVIHIPIGLLIAAAVAEFLLMFTGATSLASASRFCLLLGALGAVTAAPLGWANAAFAGYTGDLASIVTVHRWLGTTTALWSVIVVVLAEVSRRQENPAWRVRYRAALFVCAGLVGVTGHFGGTLVFGPGYYAW